MVNLVSARNQSSLLIGCIWFILSSIAMAGDIEEENRGNMMLENNSGGNYIIEGVGAMEGEDMRGMKKHSNHHHHNHHRKPSRISNQVETGVFTTVEGVDNSGSFFNTVALVESSNTIAVSSSSDLSFTPTTFTQTLSSSYSNPTITSSPQLFPTHKKHHHHSQHRPKFNGEESYSLSLGDTHSIINVIKQGPTKTKLISIETQIFNSGSFESDGLKNHQDANENKGGVKEGNRIVITELAETAEDNELENGETETIRCQVKVIRTEIVGGESSQEEEKLCQNNINSNFFHSSSVGSDITTTTPSSIDSQSTSISSDSSTSTSIVNGNSISGIGIHFVGLSTIAQSDVVTSATSTTTDSFSTSSSISDSSSTSITDSSSITPSITADSSLISPTTTSTESVDPNLTSSTSSTRIDNAFPTATDSSSSTASVNSSGSSSSGFATVFSTTASASPTDSTSISTSSTSDPSVASAGDQSASSSAQAAFVLPGRQLSVLPIGLGIFAGVSVLALVIVGVVTYERKKYRRQFRTRKMAQQVSAAAGFNLNNNLGTQGFEVDDDGMRER